MKGANFASLRLAFTALLGLAAALPALSFDYVLEPQQIASDTWLVAGALEDFSPRNGGNIVNTAFIVTGEGVVLIDSGPSLGYGRALAAAIRRITDQPVRTVFITHRHPDHFLGSQAFPEATIAALPKTIAAIRRDGNALAENLYRLVGEAMTGTEASAPTLEAVPGPWPIGGHALELIALSGHTDADLMIYDRSTGVLFAGDLAFHERTPTTPHADIDDWRHSLTVIRALRPSLLVPGHGPVSRDLQALDQTARYLDWLHTTLRDASQRGLDTTEVLALPLPDELRRLAVSEAEFRRAVLQNYPRFEQEALVRGSR
jgi:uncharacterized sulfatase